jgi:glycosyltransferase involved in cell wall biosynthesis
MSAWPHTLPFSQSHPPVSIVTPTHNRAKFFPALLRCIQAQTYPRERLEWLIYDDGTERVEDIIKPYMSELNIRYFTSDTKILIGAKRNKLHEEARGDIVVVFDDDDYYMPDRISYAVQMLRAKKVNIVGSSRLSLYFTDDKSIWEAGPYWPNHATFGTMAYTKSYAVQHKCDETITHAEESGFTKNYSEPLYQLDPSKVMLCMCHSENTFSKDVLRTGTSKNVRKTGLKLKSFVRDKWLRDFYCAL